MHVHFEITYLQPKIVVDNWVHKYILFQSAFSPHFISSISFSCVITVLTVISFIFLKHKSLSFSTFPLCVTFIRTFILTCIYNLFITKKCRTRRTSSFVHVPGPYFSFVFCVENCQNGVRGDVLNFQNRYPLVPTRHQIFPVSEGAAGVVLEIQTNPRNVQNYIRVLCYCMAAFW